MSWSSLGSLWWLSVSPVPMFAEWNQRYTMSGLAAVAGPAAAVGLAAGAAVGAGAVVAAGVLAGAWQAASDANRGDYRAVKELATSQACHIPILEFVWAGYSVPPAPRDTHRPETVVCA